MSYTIPYTVHCANFGAADQIFMEIERETGLNLEQIFGAITNPAQGATVDPKPFAFQNSRHLYSL